MSLDFLREGEGVKKEEVNEVEEEGEGVKKEGVNEVEEEGEGINAVEDEEQEQTEEINEEEEQEDEIKIWSLCPFCWKAFLQVESLVRHKIEAHDWTFDEESMSESNSDENSDVETLVDSESESESDQEENQDQDQGQDEDQNQNQMKIHQFPGFSIWRKKIEPTETKAEDESDKNVKPIILSQPMSRSLLKSRAINPRQAKNPPAFFCSFCRAPFADAILLRKHLHRSCPVKKKFRCAICQEGFSNACNLSRHMKTQHVLP